MTSHDRDHCEIHINLPHSVASSCSAFASDGFVIVPNVLSKSTVSALNERLEYVLRGVYDRGDRPDKAPKLIKLGMIATKESSSDHTQKQKEGQPQQHTNSPKTPRQQQRKTSKIGPLGFTGSRQGAKVLQVINVHKCDSIFRKLVTSPDLGRVVAELAGWKHGARLAQDQVWAKPPGSPPLTYHRDSPYFMFTPSDVLTVWIALDDMVEELGPLVYVKGSHRWGEGRVGSAGTFFQRDGGVSLLRSAAEREGIRDFDTEVDLISTAGLAAGGISIHNGRTWHGSGANNSASKPRRGLGLHFVPAEVKFTAEAAKSSLWKRYVSGGNGVDANGGNGIACSDIELQEEDFPIVWNPSRANNDE